MAADHKHIGIWFSLVLTIILSSACIRSAYAQTGPEYYEYPQNHLPWFTIESDHFLVHYQLGNSRSAQVASVVAEQVYEPVTTLYDHRPEKKVSILLRDREDYSNGAAYFFDDKIEIWVPSLDTPLRGTHHWMRNVITHEFIHIVQLQASMKRSKSIPAVYFQWLSYEDVRRPDVLYGFPNGVVSHPFSAVSIPAWFAEGTAQYQLEGLEFDYRDSHREMVLRSQMLSGSELSFANMNHFNSKNSLERELVYNQGFAFTSFLVNKFGEDIVADLSKTAAETGINNFNRVIEATTGITGSELFDEWVQGQRSIYKQQVAGLEESDYKIIEPDGFYNFYPQISPDNNKLAYLTNRGRDYARTQLVIEGQNGLKAIDQIDENERMGSLHRRTPKADLDFVNSRFSFSSDSRYIAYSRPHKNIFGEKYQDLFIYDMDREDKKQVTRSARLQDPAWHPSGKMLIAVQQNDGTQNLVRVQPDDGTVQPLTRFSAGETVYTPVWHPNGRELYFAAARMGSRNLFRIAIDDPESIEPVLAHPYVDYRDPWVDESGEYLYYSSDINGIFNIYRREIHGGLTTQITSVYGGAFMPFSRGDSLWFSVYTSQGYKLAKTSRFGFESSTAEPVQSVSNTDLNLADGNYSNLNQSDFSTIGSLDFPNRSGGSAVEFEIETHSGAEQRTWSPYSETATGFSFFPVVRFDNYTKLNGSNSRLLGRGNFGLLGENLWRDLKLGGYFSTRDVTENISLFGGALFGPGSTPASGIGNFFSPSRLNELDRDLFLTFEHRGLPFIKKSWSPTVTIELYNLKRNVKRGLSIEEFPCTSCLPETKSIDIRYSVWEANLFLNSKLNRWSMFELGASYSPYNVTTDSFYSEEFRETIPASTSEYFRGTTLSAAYVVGLDEPIRHADITPVGIKSRFMYRYQPGNLLKEYEINDGTLRPVYQKETNHSLEWTARYGFPLHGYSTGMITSRAFGYLNSPADTFYLDYTGGLAGMQSYPFFALGGTKTAFLRASFLTPLIQNMGRQAGPYSLDKLFGHLFIEAGNGWGSSLETGNNLKYGMGAELRFAFNSYYLFPLKFFINSTYGFNEFRVSLPDDFVTTSGRQTVVYGQELLFHFGLTFDFALL